MPAGPPLPAGPDGLVWPGRLEVDLADGTTETLGVSRWPGVMPEGVQAEDDEHGPSTLTFTIKRTPTQAWPDLQGGNPIRYYRTWSGAETCVWRGRIRETPEASDPTTFDVTVTCDGEQVKLDDDNHVGAWIVSHFDAWSDLRNAPVIDLNVNDPIDTWDAEGPLGAGSVAIQAGSKGGISLGVPQGTPVRGYQKIGVWLDASKYPNLQQFFVELYTSLGVGISSVPYNLVVCGSHSPHFLVSSRVNYYSGPLDALDAHELLRIDAGLGVAPMPYIGIFLEHVPTIVTTTGPLPPLDPAIVQVFDFHEDAQAHSVTFTVPDSGHNDGRATLLVCCALIDQQGVAVGPQITSAVDSSPGWSQAGQRLSTSAWGVRVHAAADRTITLHCYDAAATGRWAVKVVEIVGAKPSGLDADNTSGYGGSYGGQTLAIAAHASGSGTPNYTAFLMVGAYTHQPAGSSRTPAAISGGDAHGWTPAGSESGSDAGVAYGGVMVWSDFNSHAAGVAPGATATFDAPAGPADATFLGIVPLVVPDDPQSATTSAPDMDTADTTTKALRVLLASVKLAYSHDYLDNEGVSTLQVGDVVKDAVTLTPGLAQDVSQVNDTSGHLLESYVADQPTTPRQMIDGANAVLRWRWRVRQDGLLGFAPFPTTPSFQVGDWDGVTFNDAAGSGIADVYNAVYLTGQDALGREVQTKRGVAGLPGLAGYALADVAEADVHGPGPGAPWWDMSLPPPAGWYGALLGAVEWDASTASLQATSTTPWDGEGVSVFHVKLGEGFTPGVEYVAYVTLEMSDALWTDGVQSMVTCRVYGGNYRYRAARYDVQAAAGDNTPNTYAVAFIANSSWMGLHLVAGVKSAASSGVQTFKLRGVTMKRVSASPLDAHGIRRSQVVTVQNPLTRALGDKVADAFLVDVARSQLRGSISVTGWAARDMTGAAIPAASLLGRAGDLVRLTNRIDPVTGTLGRNARVIGVQYADASDTATIQLDNTRTRLDVLQARMAQK